MMSAARRRVSRGTGIAADDCARLRISTEFRYEGSAGGQPLSITNIFVTRVRDGVIIESRDYADHAAAARAFSHLPAVAARVAAGQPGE